MKIQILLALIVFVVAILVGLFGVIFYINKRRGK